MVTQKEYVRIANAAGHYQLSHSIPYKVGNHWAFRKGCPVKTDKGCALPHDNRPVCCRIYPFVAIPSPNGRINGYEIVLDLTHCPAWKEFGEQFEQVKKEFIEAVS